MKSVNIIVATSINGVIGKDGKLPWNLPLDLIHFKTITTGKTVIMGRKCYESIGGPLPNRENIVISRQDIKFDGCIKANSIVEAIDMATNSETFIIGGGEIYEQAFSLATNLYLTTINQIIEGDVILKGLNPQLWELEVSRGPINNNGYTFFIEKYFRK